MFSGDKSKSAYPCVLSLVTASLLLAVTGCSETTGGTQGAACQKVTECASGYICYSGTCRAGQNAQLICQGDIDIDTDNDGVIDIQGCNPEGTNPNELLRVICVSNSCRFAAGDPPVLTSTNTPPADAGMGPVPDAGVVGNPDASMMGPTDAAFVTPTACSFPTLQAANEDTNAPALIGSPTVNGQASSNSVGSGEMFTVQFTVTEGCGLASAKVVIGAAAAGGTSDAPERMTLNLTPGNGIENGVPSTNQTTVTVEGLISPCLRNTAQYQLLELHLVDYAGNTRYYEPDPTTGVLQQGEKKGDVLTNAAVPGATISVTGTGVTEAPPPALNTLSASRNASGGIDVTAGVGAQAMDCHFQRLEVTATSSRGQTLSAFSETPVGTPAAGDALTATIDVPACAQDGNWSITSVKLVDSAVRSVHYSSSAGGNFIRNDGNDSMVAAASVALMGGTDSESPDFGDIQVQSVGDPSGTAVSLNLAVSDDDCLLGTTTVHLVHESGTPTFSQTLSEGSDTLSAGCMPIPMCAKSGVYKLSTVSASDKGMSTVTLSENAGAYSVSKTDSSTSGWAPNSIITVQHN